MTDWKQNATVTPDKKRGNKHAKHKEQDHFGKWLRASMRLLHSNSILKYLQQAHFNHGNIVLHYFYIDYPRELFAGGTNWQDPLEVDWFRQKKWWMSEPDKIKINTRWHI